MKCERCGHDSAVLQVTAETVVDVFDIWLARPNGPNDNYAHRLTDRIPVICVDKRKERNDANQHSDGTCKPQAAQLPAGHDPLPALPADVPPQRKTKLPVLSKAPRQRAGKVKQ